MQTCKRLHLIVVYDTVRVCVRIDFVNLYIRLYVSDYAYDDDDYYYLRCFCRIYYGSMMTIK